VAGRRLKGLDLAAIFPRFGRPASHLEGAFYYPDRGYGRICDRLAEEAGLEHIHTSSPVTQISHNGRRITRVELGHHTQLDVSAVCSTLPADLALRLLRPTPDAALLETSSTLRFRSVILVALFLNRPSVTTSASLYFPDPAVPFTRVVEPRNRSAAMAPEGQTSLIAEIPCFLNDARWVATDEALVEQVISALAGYGLVGATDVLGSEVRRISHAYPVLEAGAEEKVRRVIGYFDRFENMVVTGRNGRFTYRHLHDMMRFGVEAVDRLEATGALARRASSRVHGRIAAPAASALE
jgi:protoporphyrinogen oxidase